jgi:aldose 1-epimerase
MSITTVPYGRTAAGESVQLFRLANGAGLEVEIISYGAAVASLRAPDREGILADITLGYDTLAEWERGECYFGAIVGRFGNRLAHGRFSLDGRDYQAPVNNGSHSLHGGDEGFHRKVWTAEIVGDNAVQLTYESPDGEQGYPGTLTAQVTYTLGAENELAIDYALRTDAPTIANLTNHAYFNLTGDDGATILGHKLRLAAERYVITDAGLIPTGELPTVAGTPMDFRHATPIGARINEAFPPLVAAGGYDHTYVLDGEGYRLVGEVYEPVHGRVMEVFTTEPGVQFYSGNFLRDEPGKGGRVYPYRGGLCLETQHFPDSPNHPHFPSTVLRPGKTFTSKTAYRFSTR